MGKEREGLAYPSSKSRKLVAEPESLLMKVMQPTGVPEEERSFWAVMMGPMALVRRW